jgi:hypothetical protein
MSKKPKRTTRRINLDFDDKFGPISLTRLDRALITIMLVFGLLVIVYTLITQPSAPITLILRALHFQLSRLGFVLALVMLGLAVYIGGVRKGDVTPYFRRGTYAVFGMMVFEALIGAALYFVIGVRPGQEVHLIYGAGSVLALPFFVFVEVTAQKRPAMGSYVWGFALLTGIIVRSMGTGPL